MKPSAASLDVLLTLIARNTTDGPSQLAAFAAALSERPCRKGDLFLRTGEQARYAGTAIDGVHGEF